MQNYFDEDVSRGFHWFRNFMSDEEWNKRRARVEEHIEHAIMSGHGLSSLPEEEFLRVNFDRDKIVWYLYLMDTCLHDANSYEPVAGARVIAIFKRIGEHLEELKAITDVNKKVRRLIKNDPSEADAVLFELLTALLWARNGYQVSFLPELKSEKQPDLKAVKDGKEFFIECKRLSKASVYADKEKEKWLKMSRHVVHLLAAMDLVLEVIFHEELSELKETFLLDVLKNKLKKKPKPGLLLTNSKVTVRVSGVNYNQIHAHLLNFSVRNPSPQLAELVGGRRDDSFGFTHGVAADHFRLGSGLGNNVFIDRIRKAYGIYWKCTAPASVEKKARDIFAHLKAALQQLPTVPNSVIHIGIETYDGPEVEQERFKKINSTMNRFDIKGQNLTWVYCHFFQSYAPPDQMYVFDESSFRFHNVALNVPEPLEITSMIVPWENTEENNLHWLKPQP